MLIISDAAFPPNRYFAMSGMTLCIGSKSLSSWSLRPWLFLRHHEVPFRELLIPLGQTDTRSRILQYSPSGRVPVLLNGKLRIWESQAICEYAAETFALPGAWPMDPAARAYARSVCHEMHAGFADLRKEMPFDARRQPEAKALSDAAQADVDRVLTIWREARSRFGWNGDWLFGNFGIADAMFAPVAWRFVSYAVDLGKVEREYVEQVMSHPAMQAWLEDGAAEVVATANETLPSAASQSVASEDENASETRTPPATVTASEVPKPTPKTAKPDEEIPAKSAAKSSQKADELAKPAPAAAKAASQKPVPTAQDVDIPEDEMPPTRPAAKAEKPERIDTAPAESSEQPVSPKPQAAEPSEDLDIPEDEMPPRRPTVTASKSETAASRKASKPAGQRLRSVIMPD